MHKVEMFFGEYVTCPFLDKEIYNILKNERFGVKVSVVITPPMENGKASTPIEHAFTSLIHGKFSTEDWLKKIARNDLTAGHISKDLLSVPVVDGEYTVSLVYKYFQHTEEDNTTVIYEMSCQLASADLLAYKSGLCELHIIGTANLYEAIKESLDVNSARHSS